MNSKIWSKEEISSFCLELSLLLKAGLPAETCFSILAEEETDHKKIEILKELYRKATYGESVYEAMTEADVFPDYMLKTVLMGEETGYLDTVFWALSKYYDNRRRTEQALKETVVFPIILLCMMLVVVFILMTEVLPVFQDVFAQLGGTLSPLAMFFLNIGTVLQNAKIVFVILAVFVIVMILTVVFHERTRNKWNAFWMKRFVNTKAGELYESAHFASALHMGVTGGLDSDRALELAEDFCEKDMKNRIHSCREAAMIGTPLALAIEEQALLKPMYCRMLSVGIKTGALDSTLEAIAHRTEEEASDELQKLASRVEPTVVILLCVIVGVLLLSVMFPLVGIMNSLG